MAVAGCMAGYWAHKHVLFTRSKRPVPGTNLINTVVAQMLGLGGVVMGVGELILVELTTQESLPATKIPIIVTIVVGVVIFLLPYEWAFRHYVRNSELEEPLSLFDENRILLPSEYDRLNPSSAKKSLREYMGYCEFRKMADPVMHMLSDRSAALFL